MQVQGKCCADVTFYVRLVLYSCASSALCMSTVACALELFPRGDFTIPLSICAQQLLVTAQSNWDVQQIAVCACFLMFIYNLLVAYCQFKELLCQSDFWHVCLILRYAWALSLLERERGRGDGIKRCCKERRKRFEEKEMPIRRDVKRSKVQWKHVKMECQEKEATVDKSKRRDVKRNRWQSQEKAKPKERDFKLHRAGACKW